MNPKIEKLNRDIEKTETKIAELQDKLREYKKQKTDLENSELIAFCRDNNLTPAELAVFLQKRNAKETEDDHEN